MARVSDVTFSGEVIGSRNNGELKKAGLIWISDPYISRGSTTDNDDYRYS